jgi:beta-fructofuranosidase
MAKSKDMVTWEDCQPPIRNGTTTSYDALGVFSGSIVSRLVEGRRVLFLFYTSVSALPIHWSKEYIEGCESQSVAFSTDFGRSWHRYQNNPLLSVPPKRESTTGWRDPFVSQWKNMSTLLGTDPSTEYMMLSSGQKGRGGQLHLYASENILDWNLESTILDVQENTSISSTSKLKWGRNFECASFFSIGQRNYILVGVEEDLDSKRHNRNYTLWLCGTLSLHDGSPKFNITGHGTLDRGILYAIHIFRDSQDRLLQLGWADEAANRRVVKQQWWAGCLAHPRELFEISRYISDVRLEDDAWIIDKEAGIMTTLGIRPAAQVQDLRSGSKTYSLDDFRNIRSTNYEVKATFRNLSGNETFTFNVRQSPNSEEVTKIIIDLKDQLISVDRKQSFIENLGESFSDSGHFTLLPDEDLHVRFFVDNSIIEVYTNDRFALTSRIYPSLDTSICASYDFGGFEEDYVIFKCWEGVKNAWPQRGDESPVLGLGHAVLDLEDQKPRMVSSGLFGKAPVCA